MFRGRLGMKGGIRRSNYEASNHKLECEGAQ